MKTRVSLRYFVNDCSFEELLCKDKAVSVHHRNLLVLATERYKVQHRLAADIMNDISEQRSMS